MVTLQKVLTGLRSYLDSELLIKINGIQKWIAGAGLAMAIDNGTNIFNSLKQNPMIKALGIIADNDMIEVEKLYRYVIEQAKKGPVTLSIPLIGALTLNEEDVTKLYQRIMES